MSGDTRGAARPLVEQLRDLGQPLAGRHALHEVRRVAADIMGVDETEIPAEMPFAELGFDSLAAVELSVELSGLTGLELPVVLGFNYPTPVELAAYLVAELLGEAEASRECSGSARATAAAADDDVAIVGMSCRYPGGVGSPEELWQLVIDGVDAIGDFPTGRGWHLDALYHPDPSHPGTSCTRHGGFLLDADMFDAAFFGIGRREAMAMDPQQRLVLEAAWAALEDAFIDPTALKGSATAVYVGIATHDYGSRAGDVPDEVAGYFSLGTAGSVASGRVAYTFGLEGPAVTVDTACSSSLVALHLAVQALRNGDCSLALAGGATVMALPTAFVEFSRLGALSPDGRCRSFAESANGTGWSEGVGMLVLERLSDARRNGHVVAAVVRATAINQDGASNGLSAPNGVAQLKVLRRALAAAGLKPDDIDAVEAHGTATVLGDPIEADALIAAYGRNRAPGHPLLIGSLKSNIGHSQAAAGVGGVIKMVMALRHGQLPATLHVDRPSTRIEWSAGSVQLLREATPWPATPARPRRAGISAFGVSGTNAHVIIEEAAVGDPAPADEPAVRAIGSATLRATRRAQDPTPASDGEVPPAGRPVAWIISARGHDALLRQARQLHEFATTHPDAHPLAVARTLSAGRTRFEQRAIVVGKSLEDLRCGLEAVIDGRQVDNVVRGSGRDDRKVAFAFPGQGAQWVGMGAALRHSSEAFARRLAECAQALSPYVDWSLEAVLGGQPGAVSLDAVDVVQPALWAMMVSLAAAWSEAGVVPEVVIGHSQGEIAAATVAGALSLEDGARVVALRSRLIRGIAGSGGMLSLAQSVAEAHALLAPWGERLSIAADNGPRSVVVSGPDDTLDAFEWACGEAGVWAKRVAVDYASHSPAVEALRGPILEALAPVRGQPASCAMFSTVRGRLVSGEEVDGSYWYENLRNTVQLAAGLRQLCQDGVDTIVEVSPHPLLTSAIEDTIEQLGPESDHVGVFGTLHRHDGGGERFLCAVAQAHVHGVAITWSRLLGSGPGTTLPTYPFERQRFWLDQPAASAEATLAAGCQQLDHPLLRTSLAVAGRDEYLLSGRFTLDRHPWLRDHGVLGRVLVPGTAFLELSMYAAQHVGLNRVEELTLENPAVVSETTALDIQVWIGALDASGVRAVTVSSRPVDESAETRGVSAWSRHASGTLTLGSAAVCDVASPAVGDFGSATPDGAEPIDTAELYRLLDRRGYAYGPAFRRLSQGWTRCNASPAGVEVAVVADLAEPEAQDAGSFCVHPALLDATLHGAHRLVTASDDQVGSDATVWLPFSWSGVTVGPGRVARLRARLLSAGPETLALQAWDERGTPVVSADRIVLRPVQAEQLRCRDGNRGRLYSVEWLPVAVGSRPDGQQLRVALLGNDTHSLFGPTSGGRFTELDEVLESLVSAPAQVLVHFPPTTTGTDLGAAADALRPRLGRALSLLQQWVGDPRTSGSTLALVTRNATGPQSEALPDVAGSALVGFMRSVAAEHPGQLRIIDVDAPPSWEHLTRALANEELEVALRKGVAYRPRLRPFAASQPNPSRPRRLDPDGTVLITGGLSGIGLAVAGHLVEHHGIRHLALLSRGDHTGASAAVESLRSRGVDVQVVHCDVADRASLAAVIGSIPPAQPLTAVVHSAGVLYDGVVTSLDRQRVDAVLRPKVDGATNLHELTVGADLQAFVLCSSVAAVVGSAGQAAYGAANAYLDALANLRAGQGMAALSIAWGQWSTASDLIGHLDAISLNRLAQQGIVSMAAEDGLALFDDALDADRTCVVAAEWNTAALGDLRDHGLLSPALSDLAARPRDAGRTPSPAELVTDLDGPERAAAIDKLVLAEIASIQGQPPGAEIDRSRTFKDLGFDSLMAVEFRNRLRASTGLTLPSTLVFDHPTPAQVAAEVLRRLASRTPHAFEVDSLDRGLGQMESAVRALPVADKAQRRAARARLARLLDELADDRAGDIVDGVNPASASADELFRLIDEDLNVR